MRLAATGAFLSRHGFKNTLFATRAMHLRRVHVRVFPYMALAFLWQEVEIEIETEKERETAGKQRRWSGDVALCQLLDTENLFVTGPPSPPPNLAVRRSPLTGPPPAEYFSAADVN